MSSFKKKLGRKIAEYRVRAGLTQQQLAEKSSYSIEFISLVERGINAPSVEGCDRLARARGVELMELFLF